MPPRPRIAILVNGDSNSAMAQRGRAFADRAKQFDCQICYRDGGKISATFAMLRFLRQTQPRLVYALDMAISGVTAALIYRLLSRAKVIIDTGDAIYELARNSGMRGPIGLGFTWLLEETGYQCADQIVVRGTKHRALLQSRGIDAVAIHDGVDIEYVRSAVVEVVKNMPTEVGTPGRQFTIGLIGASIWSEKLQMCYGWELVELLGIMREEPVRALMIGDGSGIAHLQHRANELGVQDRIEFAGRVPFEQLSAYLAKMDVCLSTQTNDTPGNVRTTGKLPLYLAAGKFVLASDVGEASLVLPPIMRVPFDGSRDAQYPAKLAERVRLLLRDRSLLTATDTVAVARKHFEYDDLAKRFSDCVLEVLSR